MTEDITPPDSLQGRFPHTHKYYWTENRGNYEPVYDAQEDRIHFEFIMFSYSACNCGQSARRTRIVTNEEEK